MERNFNQHIGYYIQETARILTRVHNEMLSRHGISFAQFRVLNCLWDHDGMNQSEIADLLHITPASLSALLNILVKKNLLERRVDSVDTRSRRIHLTSAGEKLKIVSWEIIETLESALSEAFTHAEKTLLLEWLEAVMGNIQSREAAISGPDGRASTEYTEEE
jgi:MarR family transcriptional regulator, transcriptional regulator for hemolysin